MKILTSIVLLAMSLTSSIAFCESTSFISGGEIAATNRWADEHFSGDVTKLPFSFKLGDESSATVLGRSKAEVTNEKIDDHSERRTLKWVDPQTNLETRVEVVEYLDYPSVEWTVRFKNNGEGDSPILSEIEAIDLTKELSPTEQAILHHQKGSTAVPNDFEPYQTALEAGAERKFTAAGGRGTNGDWPYFNLNWGKQGLIVVMGWPGQWNLAFQRSAAGELTIRGGQEQAHFKLHPGESARTPLIVIQSYDGDWIRGQNVWRRWIVAHNLPRPEGKLPPTQMVACSSHQFNEMLNANEENQKEFIDRYLEEKFPLDYWWMDAGWYPNDGTWVTTGTWEVDKNRFPNGLRAITDHAHEKGVKSIVWFEPERVAPNSWLYNERPQWLLTPPPNPGNQAYDERWRLLDLGNKEARDWLISHVNQLIETQGIDLYRQDFNVDPLMFWRNGEPEDRQGIAENHYIEGYLAFWDGILAAHPNVRIDNCASGGRRMDLESMRRSVPLLRSDHLFEPNGQQAHTYGLSLWIPYHGTGTLVGKSAIGLNTGEGVSGYDFRSHMAPSFTACWDLRDKSLDYDSLRRLVGDFKKISPLYFGDYYPLTPHSLATNEWIAWQFNNPEKGETIVQAFRRQDSEEPEKALKLQGLDPTATYQVEPLGDGDAWSESGADLMEKGLVAKLGEKRSAGLYFLTKR